MPETVRVSFLYALGARVRWDDCDAPPEAIYEVVWRSWHQGQASTCVRYGLAPLGGASGDSTWESAYEADLEPLEDSP